MLLNCGPPEYRENFRFRFQEYPSVINVRVHKSVGQNKASLAPSMATTTRLTEESVYSISSRITRLEEARYEKKTEKSSALSITSGKPHG